MQLRFKRAEQEKDMPGREGGGTKWRAKRTVWVRLKVGHGGHDFVLPMTWQRRTLGKPVCNRSYAEGGSNTIDALSEDAASQPACGLRYERMLVTCIRSPCDKAF